MKNNPRTFQFILAGSTVGFILMVFLLTFLFRGPGTPASGPLVPTALACLAYLVLALALVGPLGKPFGHAFVDAQPGYDRALKKIGAAPLLALIRLFLLTLVFAAWIAVFGLGMGLEGDAKAQFAVLVLAFGMLAAAFVYVVSDRLTLRTLLSATLTDYPGDLRENRQQRKVFIIPVFMAVMSLLFAFSTAFLMVGRDPSAGLGTVPTLALLSTLYLAIVVTLVGNWNSNTALLFRSVLIQLDQLTAAEKNLSGRISIGSVDEIGSIAGRVNHFCEGLSGGIREVAVTYSELSSVQHRLFEGIGTAGAAAADIAVSLDQALGAIERADGVLGGCLGNAKEFALHAAGAAAKIGDQSARVADTTALVQSLMAVVATLTRDVEGARSRTEDLTRIVLQGEEDIKTLTATVAAVADRSTDLGNINKLIAAVASRTNLLAMNAAIEAAHAGDAGRGFSVVAEEIRTLAESTADHTRRTKESLGAILGLIQKATEKAGAAGASFTAVRGAADLVSGVTEQVSKAMGDEQQRSGAILALLAETETLGRDVAETTKALDALAGATAERLSSASKDQSEARELSRAMKVRYGDLSGAMASVSALSEKTEDINGHLAAFLRSFRTA